MELLVSNDFYKAGQVLTYDVRQVNLYEIFLTTIIITTFATAITLAVTKLIKTLKKKRHKPDNTWETNAST